MTHYPEYKYTQYSCSAEHHNNESWQPQRDDVQDKQKAREQATHSQLHEEFEPKTYSSLYIRRAWEDSEQHAMANFPVEQRFQGTMFFVP